MKVTIDRIGVEPPVLTDAGERTLTLLFGPSSLLDSPERIEAISQTRPGVVLGCSSAGDILDDAIYDDVLICATLQFQHTQVRSAQASVETSADSHGAGQALGRQLLGDGLAAVFVLCDGLNVNGSELARGLNEALPDGVVVTGGLAGDGPRFERTWVVCGGPPVAGLVAAVGLYGDRVRVGHGSRGGWDTFGPERTITRSEGNVLYELDGRPALELYRTYLGDRADDLPAAGLLFPLAVRPDSGSDQTLVRTILGIDDETQSLTFAGDVPQGHRARLMMANFDRLILAASSAADDARSRVTEEPVGDCASIAISCVGRRLILGERVEEELEAALEDMPEGTRQVGFYSYGEISPLTPGTCELHNQTMTLTSIWEI
jgi:hypothetical protein